MGDSHVTERVVNQLLTSVDGLGSMEGVVIIAATNRPDMIDPALLRAGRVDRLLYCGPPERVERLKILQIHMRNMPLKDVDANSLADRTKGYVGADLANLCRMAGVLALRENIEANEVSMKHFEKALGMVRASVDDATVNYYKRIAEELEGGLAKQRKKDYTAGIEAA
jgi:transitional endoplasmic reticulum ATPase